MEHDASLGAPLSLLELNQQESDAVHTLKKQLAESSTHGSFLYKLEKHFGFTLQILHSKAYCYCFPNYSLV